RALGWTSGQAGDQVFRPTENIRNDAFNRLTFQVSPEKVRCLLNGELFYEDTDPPPTSPWLMLYSAQGRRPVFRNFTLSGKPEVPTEVKLIVGDTLGGWLPDQYGGLMPQRLLLKEQKKGPTFDRWGNRIEQEELSKDVKYDWQAKGGELLGRKLD